MQGPQTLRGNRRRPNTRDLPPSVDIVLRVLAATIGSYVLTYEATAALAIALPVDKLSAVIIATNSSFVLMVALVLWSFCSRSVWLVWSVMLGVILMLAIFVKEVGP